MMYEEDRYYSAYKGEMMSRGTPAALVYARDDEV